MKSAVCWKCVKDSHLREIIRTRPGKPLECFACHASEEPAFDSEQLAEQIAPILHDHFEPGGEIPEFDDDGNERLGQEGDPLPNVIERVLGQYLPFENQIVEALIAAENFRGPEHGSRFFDDSSMYVRVPEESYYRERWETAQTELNQQKRYFCASARELFDSLFGCVDTLGIVRELPQNSELFRARSLSDERSLKGFYEDPYRHVGPPPVEHARIGRMNAEGVALFYGALDIKTCLAETRPYLWGQIVTICLQTTGPLRLFDFTQLRSLCPDKSLSFFQTDFTEQIRRIEFLRRLQSLIAQPVTRGREAEYLITQAMAEYLAHVHPEPFDGILYESAQRQGGTNIVLFPLSTGADDGASKFPISYIDNSLKLFFTNSITYGYAERKIRARNGTVSAEQLLDTTVYGIDCTS
jgi:hypothetical protein